MPTTTLPYRVGRHAKKPGRLTGPDHRIFCGLPDRPNRVGTVRSARPRALVKQGVKPVPQRLMIAAEKLRGLNGGPPAQRFSHTVHSQREAPAPTRILRMPARVIGMGQDLKIAAPVVAANTVSVMHNLATREKPADLSLRDQSMLRDVSVLVARMVWPVFKDIAVRGHHGMPTRTRGSSVRCATASLATWFP